MKTEQHSGGKHCQRFDCQFHSQIYEKLKKTPKTTKTISAPPGGDASYLG